MQKKKQDNDDVVLYIALAKLLSISPVTILDQQGEPNSRVRFSKLRYIICWP